MTYVRARNRFAVVTALFVTTAFFTISSTTSASASTASRCQETQLDVQLVRDGGSHGHVASLIVVTNVSSTSCSVSGYPIVRVTDSPKAGFSLVAKDTLRGFMGGLGLNGTSSVSVPKVKLRAHGGTASSMVEGDVSGSSVCLWFKMMSVSLPHLRPGYRFKTLIPTCTLPQVHPFVKGTSGSTPN